MSGPIVMSGLRIVVSSLPQNHRKPAQDADQPHEGHDGGGLVRDQGGEHERRDGLQERQRDAGLMRFKASENDRYATPVTMTPK